MRLPSYSYEPEDLVRHLSVAAEDGPETVIEADDYLQPQQHAPPIPLDDSRDNNNLKVGIFVKAGTVFTNIFCSYALD